MTDSVLPWSVPVLHYILEKSCAMGSSFLFFFKYLQNVLLNTSQVTYLAWSYFFLLYLLHYFGSRFCIIIQQEYFPSSKCLQSGRHFVRYILVYLQAFMMPSIKIIFHTLYARIQPCIIPLPSLCSTVKAMHSF